MADGTGGEHVPQLMKFYVAAGTATLIATPSQLLATSDGAGGLSVVDEKVMWSEQGIVDRKAQLIGRQVTFTVDGLTFKPATMDTLFGISSSATASMRTVGAETATARRVTDTTEDQYFRFLVQYTDSDLDKPIQWYFPRTKLSGGLDLAFDKTAWNQHSLTVQAFAPADGGGDVMEQLTQTGS